MSWEDEQRQRNGIPRRGGLWICLRKGVSWIPGKEKVILNKRDIASKGLGVGGKKPVTGNMSDIIGYLLLWAN